MTFVKTRLEIEKMSPGAVLEIRLAGQEPLKNVPESVMELGHKVLSLSTDDTPAKPGKQPVHRLVVQKAGATCGQA